MAKLVGSLVSMKKEVITRTIATILGGLVLGFIWWFWEFIKPPLWHAVAWSWSMLLWIMFTAWQMTVAGVTLPRWLLVAVFAIAGWQVFKWLHAAWVKRFPEESSSGPDYRDFNAMSYKGINWTWSWSDTGHVINLQHFCPYCGRLVRHASSPKWDYEPRYQFTCHNCDQFEYERRGSLDDFFGEVELEIVHRSKHGGQIRPPERQS